MTIESFIQAMPKADLHVHLEGAVSKNALLLIAEQNEVSESVKHFSDWVHLIDKPDYDRLDDLIRFLSTWVRLPEDLTRFVYDFGVSMAKRNVRYAEITVNPALYTEVSLTLEQFIAAINDGRDRAQRAWGVKMGWILAVPREEPRKADDYARWALTASARRAGVVGLGLSGKETAQPVGQFERAFASVEKKGLPRLPHSGELLGADGVLKVIQLLHPNRIADGWGVIESPEVVRLLVEQQIALDISMVRAVLHKKISGYADYPLRQLYEEGVPLTIGSDMPALYKTSLDEQYLAAVELAGLEMDELEDIALNAVRVSQLADDEKQTMLSEFKQAYASLRDEHLSQPTP